MCAEQSGTERSGVVQRLRAWYRPERRGFEQRGKAKRNQTTEVKLCSAETQAVRCGVARLCVVQSEATRREARRAERRASENTGGVAVSAQMRRMVARRRGE